MVDGVGVQIETKTGVLGFVGLSFSATVLSLFFEVGSIFISLILCSYFDKHDRLFWTHGKHDTLFCHILCVCLNHIYVYTLAFLAT